MENRPESVLPRTVTPTARRTRSGWTWTPLALLALLVLVPAGGCGSSDTQDPGELLGAAPWVVFAGNIDGEWDIFSIRSDGSDFTRHTLGYPPGTNPDPTLSPDSTEIVFSAGLDPARVWIMNFGGTDLRELDGDAPDGATPTFGATNNDVFYTGLVNLCGDLFHYDRTERDWSTLNQDGPPLLFPSISRDGRSWLAGTNPCGAGYTAFNLYRGSVSESGQIEQLTDFGVSPSPGPEPITYTGTHPAWSRTGETYLWTYGESSQPGGVSCDVTTIACDPVGEGGLPCGPTTSALQTQFNASMPAWSPDGDEVAFLRAPAAPCNGGTEVGPKDIWIMDASGGSLRNLTGGLTVTIDGEATPFSEVAHPSFRGSP